MRVIRYLIALVVGLMPWLGFHGILDYVIKGGVDPSWEVWTVRVVGFVLAYSLWIFGTRNRLRERILR